MTINDFYFKFDNPDLAGVDLAAAGVYRNADGKLTSDNRSVSVDEVGIIYTQNGKVVVSGDEEIPVMESIAGWHVNIRSLDCELSKILAALPNQTFPSTPVRVWA